jgi:hypothetical protein
MSSKYRFINISVKLTLVLFLILISVLLFLYYRYKSVEDKLVSVQENTQEFFEYGYSEKCVNTKHTYKDGRRIVLKVKDIAALDNNDDVVMLFEYEHERGKYQYPIILAGLPLGGDETPRTYPNLSNTKGESIGLVNEELINKYLKPGDMVLVCIPTEINEVIPDGWEFWEFWFRPLNEKQKLHLEGMKQIVESVETRSTPPQSGTYLIGTEIIISRDFEVSDMRRN